MDKALYVGLSSSSANNNILLHRGYVDALRAFGWDTTWLGHAEAKTASLEPFDLIIWDSCVPATVLERIDPKRCCLIVLGGAGEDLSHYPSYAEKIALATSSFNYLDEPVWILTPQHLEPNRILSKQAYYVMKYARRFVKFARPSFFRNAGIQFMHLPFASDPQLFYPIQAPAKRLRWVFCGSLSGRRLIPRLMKESGSRKWAYEVVAPELGRSVDPTDLNVIYNQATFGVNEQHLMSFGREINQRAFDYGQAGILQVTDMGYMCAPLFGEFCAPYAGKLARPEDHDYALELLESGIERSGDKIHEHFSKQHSFCARLAVLSLATGFDLTRGHLRLSDYAAQRDAWTAFPHLVCPSSG